MSYICTCTYNRLLKWAIVIVKSNYDSSIINVHVIKLSVFSDRLNTIPYTVCMMYQLCQNVLMIVGVISLTLYYNFVLLLQPTLKKQNKMFDYMIHSQ